MVQRAYKLLYQPNEDINSIHNNLSLADCIEQINVAETAAELNNICASIFHSYGYDYYVYGSEMSSANQVSVFINSNAPDNLIKHYVENDSLEHDPRVSHGRKSFTPLYWKGLFNNKNFSQPVRSVMDDLWDAGIKSGVSMALCGINSEPAMMHFACEQKGNRADAHIFQTLPFISFLMSFIYEAIRRILVSSNQSNKKVSSITDLTIRESEILKYAARGESTSDMSERLNISENTVLYHMKNIHRKLGVHTRQHAIAKALATNLIKL